jgi:hypothetical protein
MGILQQQKGVFLGLQRAVINAMEREWVPGVVVIPVATVDKDEKIKSIFLYRIPVYLMPKN